jgi:hypothetical protein
VNEQLYARGMERLEATMMPANFSTMVSEFMNTNIPEHCPALVQNRYHNGQPCMIPARRYLQDAVQHGHQGIETKSLCYLSG